MRLQRGAAYLIPFSSFSILGNHHLDTKKRRSSGCFLYVACLISSSRSFWDYIIDFYQFDWTGITIVGITFVVFSLDFSSFEFQSSMFQFVSEGNLTLQYLCYFWSPIRVFVGICINFSYEFGPPWCNAFCLSPEEPFGLLLHLNISTYLRIPSLRSHLSKYAVASIFHSHTI